MKLGRGHAGEDLGEGNGVGYDHNIYIYVYIYNAYMYTVLKK